MEKKGTFSPAAGHLDVTRSVLAIASREKEKLKVVTVALTTDSDGFHRFSFRIQRRIRHIACPGAFHVESLACREKPTVLFALLTVLLRLQKWTVLFCSSAMLMLAFTSAHGSAGSDHLASKAANPLSLGGSLKIPSNAPFGLLTGRCGMV